MPIILRYLWIILLIIYILSPLDAHPLFLDDLIASGILLWLLYRDPGRQERGGYRASREQTREESPQTKADALTLEDAYRILGVTPDTPLQEVKRAYKEKISKSHPDKVSHLGEELRDKAAEVTLRLNTAMRMIRNSRR